MKIVIIGAGASGLVAAIRASSLGAGITLLEQQPRVAKKLSQTGNGRCNLLNTEDFTGHYYGNDASFASDVLSSYDVTTLLRFFEDLGLVLTEEYGGRVFPYSQKADSVVDMLRFRCQANGVNVLCDAQVTDIKKEKTGFSIHYTMEGKRKLLRCDKVLVCTGGPASPKLGGTMSGFLLLSRLGHTYTEITPSLVPLTVSDKDIASLKGIRSHAEIVLLSGESELKRARGEVQFTEYGLSGPCIFDVSGLAAKHPECTIQLNLLPQYTLEEISALLMKRISDYPCLTCNDLLTGFIQNRLGRFLLLREGISLNSPLQELSEGQVRNIASLIAGVSFHISGNKGMEMAQVTFGGISTNEVNPHTMESRLMNGLYICGETLDIVGDCGGYNLRWAFATGLTAADAATEEIK